MTMGQPPPIDRLAKLQPAVSTSADVRAVLGDPPGRGAVHVPNLPPADIWQYEYVQMEGTKAKMRMLLVFMDKSTGVYGGYMWFSSGQLLSQTR
jgi:hypothetical protein